MHCISELYKPFFVYESILDQFLSSSTAAISQTFQTNGRASVKEKGHKKRPIIICSHALKLNYS